MIKIKICLANSIIKKKFFFIYNLNLIMKSFILLIFFKINNLFNLNVFKQNNKYYFLNLLLKKI